MATALVYLLIFLNGAVSLAVPWIGITIAYLFALLTPQSIWYWAFDGIRPFFMIALPPLIGFALAVVTGRVRFERLLTRINAYLFVMWVCLTLAYFFGPYVEVVNPSRFFDPAFMFESLQITFLTYFVAVLLIDSDGKLKAAALVMVLTVAYLTWWANAQYLFEGQWGRIQGPQTPGGLGIYRDENIFAMLFVVGIPFLFYLGKYVESRLLRWAIWAVIPLAWHAIFLTASRGGLLAVAATLMLFFLRSDRKAVGALAMVAFAAAFAWQAGDVMTERAFSLGEYEEDASATGRLEAWETAVAMMTAHPFLGVGFASFGQAFPSFSNDVPRIAHNSVFQIGAEWGVIAMIAYLLLVFHALNQLRKNGNLLRKLPSTDRTRFLYCVNEATLLGLFGIFACSMFLSLEAFEPFYYLLFLANSVLLASASETRPKREVLTGAHLPRPAWLHGRNRAIPGTAAAAQREPS